MIGLVLAAIAYIRAYAFPDTGSRWRWLLSVNNSSFSKGNGRGLYCVTSTDSFGLRSGAGGPAGPLPW